MKIVLLSQSFNTDIYLTIGPKFKAFLSLPDKQKEALLDDVEADESFINYQEILTLDSIKAKGNKVTLYPNMDYSDLSELKTAKPRLQRDLDRWLTARGVL